MAQREKTDSYDVGIVRTWGAAVLRPVHDCAMVTGQS